MADSPIIAGPPPAEFKAVEDFLPKIDFSIDTTYAALIADMAPEDVELAKALFVCNGVGADAGRMLWPDVPDGTAKKRGSRGANDPNIKALLAHFTMLAESDGEDVTLDEIERRTIAQWRTTKDAKVFADLTPRVMEMKGLSFKKKAANADTPVEEALKIADQILAGRKGQAIMQPAGALH